MHPIEQIEWRHASTLQGNDYNPNNVFNPELRLLEHSILSTGWIQPVLINASDIIIDGFHRVQIAQNSKTLHARDGGMVPCCIIDVGDAEARLMTIRINRAKGAHQGKRLSMIVQDLIDNYGLNVDEIKKGIGCTKAELDLLYAGDVFIAKDIKNAKYSRAWIPVEAP